jgi:C_GCAxxG_C_C family probable redox protein
MKEGAAEKAYQLGKEYEKDYKGCAQCVLAALQDAFGIRNKEVFKAATGLAGGSGGCTDGNCGAYSGAIMFISSLIGRDRDDFADKSGAVRNNMELAQKIHDRFIQEYGSVICRNIHTKLFGRPYYLPDPEEHEKFEKAGAHTKHCPEVVGKAARWAAELVNEANLV